MTPRRLVAALLALGIMVGGAVLGASPVAATGGEPAVQLSVTASPPFAGAGTEVAITGAGWPANTLISVSLCGNYFLNGTSDCAPSASNTTTSLADGRFFTEIVVAVPPSPCPCVVHASSPDTDQTVNQPFEVIGATTSTPVVDVQRRDVEVTTDLTGSGPWQAYFGGAAERSYTLTVRNTGTAVLLDPPITVAVGEGEDPTDIVARPKLGEIAVGAEVTRTIPISIDGPTFGRYTVKTTISGIDVPVAVSDTTTSYPWGLFVLGWLAIQIPLLGLYRRRRLDGPDDPLDREFASLLLPTPDYGVDSVREFVEPRSITVPEDQPPPRVVVSDGNGGRHRRRAGLGASR